MADSINKNRLEEVLARGFVRVGVNGDAPGFSLEENGTYTGFDVDFGRALAAALFGDPNKVEFVRQEESAKFSDVAQGIVDVTSNQATFSLNNDASEGVDFAPINFYDEQGVLVKADSEINSLEDLNNLTIGVLKDNNSKQNLENLFETLNQPFKLVTFDTADALYNAYDNNEIVAVSTNYSSLLTRIPTLSEPTNHKVLDETVSKEPVAMVIPENEPEFADVVEWVNFATFQADEFGIFSTNLSNVLADNSDPAIARFLGTQGNLGEALGLSNDFAVKIIENVGNYTEIYQRHFGEFDLPLFNFSIDPDDGFIASSLLISPPFSGNTSGLEDKLIDNDNRDVLQEVLNRGYVKVGVGDNNPGLSQQVDGKFSGFNVDLGRAIAAALFGDPNKVEFVVQPSFSQNFTATANGDVDITIDSVTQNLVRDASLGVEFPLIYAYDGQSIIAEPGIAELADLAGKKIALVEGSTSVQNIEDAFDNIGETFTPVYVDDFSGLLTPYLNDEADAVSIDFAIILSQLLDFENRKDELSAVELERLENYVLLDDVLSNETLAFVVDEKQSAWADVVRWIGYSLIQAEEFGITDENVADVAANSTDPDIKNFLGVEGNLGDSLGIPNDFAFNAITAVGNYGETYERNFGILGIDPEEVNGAQLYTEGGVLYSPPFTGKLSMSEDSNLDEVDEGTSNNKEDTENNSDNNEVVDNTSTPVENTAKPSIRTVTQDASEMEVIDLTGLEGETVTVTYEISREADFDNNIYFYMVDSDDGNIGDVTPSDSGYLERALSNVVSDGLTAADDTQNQTGSLNLTGGNILGIAIIADGTLEQAVSNIDSVNGVYLSYMGAGASTDNGNFDHIRFNSTTSTFEFEDLANGGDQDFNDIEIKMKF